MIPADLRVSIPEPAVVTPDIRPGRRVYRVSGNHAVMRVSGLSVRWPITGPPVILGLTGCCGEQKWKQLLLVGRARSGSGLKE